MQEENLFTLNVQLHTLIIVRMSTLDGEEMKVNDG